MIFDSKNIETRHSFRFKSIEVKNNLSLKYPRCLIDITKLNVSYCDELYKFLLSEVSTLMKLEGHKETTGLDDQSLSTRWDRYNLLTKYKDNKLIQELEKNILTSYEKYCILSNTEIEPIMVHCWYNVLEAGQSISEHVHDYGTYSYISGNLFVGGACDTSVTKYIIVNRDEELDMKNNVGDMTYFPMYLPHQTNTYDGDIPRVTIGINIYPKRFYEDFRKNNHNWIEHVYTS